MNDQLELKEESQKCELTCDWLTTLDTSETCNRTATHERMMGKPLRYCTEHAIILAKYTVLKTIPK